VLGVLLALFYSCLDWTRILNDSKSEADRYSSYESDDAKNFYNSLRLKSYSKNVQLIDNTNPCSIAANFSGCQKLCFAVPSNKSITSSLQALCSCPIGEKINSDGKSCVIDSTTVVMSVSVGVIKHIPYHYVTTLSFMIVYVFSYHLSVID